MFVIISIRDNNWGTLEGQGLGVRRGDYEYDPYYSGMIPSQPISKCVTYHREQVGSSPCGTLCHNHHRTRGLHRPLQNAKLVEIKFTLLVLPKLVL